MIAQDEIAFSWTPEPKWESDLYADISHWFTRYPAKDSDDKQTIVLRTIYQMVGRKLLNKSRDTREPFLRYSSIDQKIMFEQRISDDELEVDWRQSIENVLQTLHMKFIERYTKPDPADK